MKVETLECFYVFKREIGVFGVRIRSVPDVVHIRERVGDSEVAGTKNNESDFQNSC